MGETEDGSPLLGVGFLPRTLPPASPLAQVEESKTWTPGYTALLKRPARGMEVGDRQTNAQRFGGPFFFFGVLQTVGD